MKFICQSCGLYNMTWDAVEVHRLGYPDHTIVDNLGRFR